jgi:hypothetical protein
MLRRYDTTYLSIETITQDKQRFITIPQDIASHELTLEQLEAEKANQEVEFARTQVELLPIKLQELRNEIENHNRELTDDLHPKRAYFNKQIESIEKHKARLRSLIQSIQLKLNRSETLKAKNKKLKDEIDSDQAAISTNTTNIATMDARQLLLPGYIRDATSALTSARMAHDLQQYESRRAHQLLEQQRRFEHDRRQAERRIAHNSLQFSRHSHHHRGHTHHHHYQLFIEERFLAIEFSASLFNAKPWETQLQGYQQELSNYSRGRAALVTSNATLANKIRVTQDLIVSQIKEIDQIGIALYAYDDVQQRNRILSDLQAELTTRQTEETSLWTQKTALQTTIDQHNKAIATANRDIASHTANLAKYQAFSPKFSTNPIEGSVEAVAESLQQSIQALTIQIRSEQDEIRRLKRVKNNLDKNLLITNPIDTLNKLADTMRVAFRNFEANHLLNQSLSVRQCMLKAQPNIDNIVKDVDDSNVLSAYYILYGMLLNFFNIVQTEKTQPSNKALLIVINSIISGHTIVADCSTCLDSKDALDCWSKHAKLYSFMKEMTGSELIAFEKTAYEAVLVDFNITLDRYNSFGLPSNVSADARKVLNEVKLLVRPKNLIQEIDFKLLTFTLTTTSDLLKCSFPDRQDRPANPASIHENFYKLVTIINMTGPSILKKLGGVLQMLLGSLLVAASITAKVITLGFSSPMSTAGIVAGSALFLTGAGLFKNGMRKGLSKQMHNLNNTIKKEQQVDLANAEPGSVVTGVTGYTRMG